MDASNMSHDEYFRLHGCLSVERQRQLLDEGATMDAVSAEVDRVCEVMENLANSADVSDSMSATLLDAITTLRGYE